VWLFVERASAAGVTLTQADASTVISLCQRAGRAAAGN
jgi:hypothetical protein